MAPIVKQYGFPTIMALIISGIFILLPDFYLRKFLVCPKCGGVLTACYSKGNGGYYGYYKCPHCHKFNYSAVKANNKFIKYIRELIPKHSALALYEEILNDLRKENNIDKTREIKKLQRELLTENNRIESIDIKLMDSELSSEDHQRMKRNIDLRIDKINTRLDSLNFNYSDMAVKLEHAINVIKNMPEILSSGRVEHKILILGSMFPEKIQFDGEKY